MDGCEMKRFVVCCRGRQERGSDGIYIHTHINIDGAESSYCGEGAAEGTGSAASSTAVDLGLSRSGACIEGGSRGRGGGWCSVGVDWDGPAEIERRANDAESDGNRTPLCLHWRDRFGWRGRRMGELISGVACVVVWW